MNGDFFSKRPDQEAALTNLLTDRLYPPPSVKSDISPTLEELLLEINKEMPLHKKESSLPAALSNHPLTDKIHQQVTRVQERIQHYLTKKNEHPKNMFWVLHGWDASILRNPYQFLSEESRKTSGGYFLRWNGKGIAINPGLNFMSHFHRAGLHLKEIDYVIVTHPSPEASADLKELHKLYTHLNHSSPQLHVIHYYLVRQIYQDFLPYLKPSFKQQRDSVHALDFYLDSSEVEKVELSPGISLNYFYADPEKEVLGIKLDLTPLTSSNKKVRRLGFLSGTPWSPSLANQLGECDLLIAGFGNTTLDDCHRLKYNDECLGYHGTLSLMQAVNPSLLCCTEFGGREGDIRMEVLKKLRQDYALSDSPFLKKSFALPGDNGLLIDLESLCVKSSFRDELIELSHLQISTSEEEFHPIQYFSLSNCL
jgi:hypothetical protein